MKKFAFLSFLFLLLVSIVLVGCGQQVPSVSTSTSQPSGLKIKGTVFGTTLDGDLGSQIANAYVSLSGDSVNKTALTNSKGEYLFENVPAGTYGIIVTAEGYQRSSTTSVALNTSTVPADNTQAAQDIQLSSRPVILSYSPTSNSEITNGQTFVVTFNEAMDKNSFLPTLVAGGLRATVVDTTTVPLTASWSSDSKVLTLTPQGTLVSNETYTLAIPNTARDTAGYTIDIATITNNPELAQPLSSTYVTVVGGVPSAPTGLNIASFGNNAPNLISSDATRGINYADIYGSGNKTFNLSWTPSASGLVTGYKVYVAAGTSGNYVNVGAATTNNYASISLNTVLTALYGTTTLNPAESGQAYPLINTPIYFKVSAYNGDGESASSAVSGIHLVPPSLSATALDATDYAAAPATGSILNNNYTLPTLTSTYEAYIFFTEPVVPSTIATSAFTITSTTTTETRTVTAATFLTQSSTAITGGAGAYSLPAGIYAIAKITADQPIVRQLLPLRTWIITAVAGGVQDLAGNTVTTASSTGTLN